MAKYAIIWTTTKGYMPGTNGILNALEHYNFKCDKYVMHLAERQEEQGELDDYKKQWSDIKFIDAPRDITKLKKSNYWYCIYSDIHYAFNYMDYDCILFWSADCLPLCNFEYYFDIATKLDKIVLGWNEHSINFLENLSTKQPYPHTWNVPYTDIPCFVPKSKFKFLENLLKYQAREDCVLNRMDAMNYAVRDMNHEPIAVAGQLWVNNVPYIANIEIHNHPNGEKHVYTAGAKIHSAHRRYWDNNYIKNYIRGHNEISHNNAKKFNKLWNYFNTECRVKWTEGLTTYE